MQTEKKDSMDAASGGMACCVHNAPPLGRVLFSFECYVVRRKEREFMLRESEVDPISKKRFKFPYSYDV